MDFTDFTAGSDDGGRRADRVLRRFLQGAHLSSVYGALRKGLILVNARRVKPDTRIESGDVVSIASFLLQNEKPRGTETSPTKKSAQGKSPSPPFTVVFANEHFFVIDKPYGLSVQGKHSIAEKVAAYYDASVPEKKRSLSFVSGPLHRLDKNTTGILFFSWSHEGAAWFSSSLKAHRIQKKYVAIAEDAMECECVWEDFIKKNDEAASGFYTVRVASIPANGASGTMPGAKRAVTKAKALCRASYRGHDVTLAEYEIETGRMHQIRAQSAFHGFPLLGDTAYGGHRIDEAQDFFLHAYEVSIPENPVGLPPVLTAPLPTAFESFNDKILPNWRKSLIL